MAREGDYNFKGSALERGVPHEPREDPESGYGSTFLDKTKIATPQPKNDSAITLENTEGDDKIVKGNYNFEGSALERGVDPEPKQTESGYGSTFLENTKIETPDPSEESAITLENTDDKILKGNYNFEGSALDRGVDGSKLLDKTKIETPVPSGESAITLENTEGGDKIVQGNYNFEGSALERGEEYKPRVTDDGYSSTFLDKTKIETPDARGESATTLDNTEGGDTQEGDYNFEGSAFDRGVGKKDVGWSCHADSEKGLSSTYASPFLDKTKIPTPAPTGASAVTLENSST